MLSVWSRTLCKALADTLVPRMNSLSEKKAGYKIQYLEKAF